MVDEGATGGTRKAAEGTHRPRFDGRVPLPWFANVETTRYCNLKCTMCVQFNDGTTVTGPHMGPDVFATVVRELFPHISVCQPTVSGEPLMWKDFDLLLDAAEKFDVKLEVVTNGMLMTDAWTKRLSSTLSSMTISFDGATKGTFERIREGGDYERVLGAVRDLVAAIPDDANAPRLGFNCTLMRSNAGELGDLVDLAADLGLDFVTVAHVFPVTEDSKKDSLAHDLELARRSLATAGSRARDRGIHLRVNALDQVTAATARSGAERELATLDGAVLDELEVNAASTPAPGYPDAPAPPVASSTPADDTVWVCEFLWHKTYVVHDGTVRPCCVPGTPTMGTIGRQSFEEIWNGDAYRRMRQRLVMQDPEPICRGCVHVRELKRDDAGAWLQGGAVPTMDDLPCPTPVVEWEPVRDAVRYEVEFSVDGFSSVAFTSSAYRVDVTEPRYEVPLSQWAQVPPGVEVQWRALADGARPCGAGVLTRPR